MDKVSKEVRSRNMAAIKGKDTKPEITVRKFLFSKGFRYKLYDKSLPGKPDHTAPKDSARERLLLARTCGLQIFRYPKDAHRMVENKN